MSETQPNKESQLTTTTGSIVNEGAITLAQLQELTKQEHGGVDALELLKAINPDFDSNTLIKNAELQARQETNYTDNGAKGWYGVLAGGILALIGSTVFYPNPKNQTLGLFGGAGAGIGGGILAGEAMVKKTNRRKNEIIQQGARAHLLAHQVKMNSRQTPEI